MRKLTALLSVYALFVLVAPRLIVSLLPPARASHWPPPTVRPTPLPPYCPPRALVSTHMHARAHAAAAGSAAGGARHPAAAHGASPHPHPPRPLRPTVSTQTHARAPPRRTRTRVPLRASLTGAAPPELPPVAQIKAEDEVELTRLPPPSVRRHALSPAPPASRS